MTAQKNWRRMLATATTGLLVASGLALAPAVANAAPATVDGGELTWGVRESWRNYVTGPVGHGSITSDSPATVQDAPSAADGKGLTTWKNGAGSVDVEVGSGTITYEGSMNSKAHEGLGANGGPGLDQKLVSPQITVTSRTSATLSAEVTQPAFSAFPKLDNERIVLADLSFAEGDLDDGMVTASGTLSEGGNRAYVQYPVGSETDPVSFSFDRAAAASATSTTIAASTATATEGDSVEFTATVAPADAAGTVTFSHQTAEGAGEISTALPVDNGVAKFSTDGLPVGATQVTAKFTPTDESAFTASTSTSVTVTVQAEAPTPVADPKVTVTPSEDLDPAVENVVTVAGTGFVGAGAASGAYVLFGEKSVWSGGSATPRDGWIKLSWVPAGGIVNGAFEHKLTIPAGTLDPATEYQVATSAAHGLSATNRSLDTFTPVTVQQPAPVADPKVTVTPSEDLDPAVENEITVTGSGFVGAGAASGAYVLFGEKSVWSGGSATPSTGWIALEWVRAADVVDGSFERKLTIPAGTLKPGTEYQVATSAAHRLSITDRSLDTFTPVTVQTPAPVADPKVTVSPSEDLDPAVENEITVTGSGFVGAGAASGAYVLFGEKSVWSGGSATPSTGWIALEWVRAADVVDGSFERKLTIPAGTLKPGTEYQVATSAAHRLSITDRSLDTFTPVTVQTPAPVEPAITIDGERPAAATVRQGEPIDFAAGPFAEGSEFEVWIDPAGTMQPVALADVATDAVESVKVGDVTVDGSGTAAITWEVPADFAPGEYVVAFSGSNVEDYLEADFTVSQYVVSTTTLTSSADVGGSAEGVEFVATVSPETATGAVTFTNNDVAIATVPVANGTASVTADLAVGVNEVVATFVSTDATVSDSVSEALLIEVLGGGAGVGAADGGADGSGANGAGTNGSATGNVGGTIGNIVTTPVPGAKGLASTGGEGFTGLLAGGALALLLGAGLMVARRRIAVN